MKTVKFTPRPIGQPNLKLKKSVIAAYENLISCACDLQLQLGVCLEDPKDQEVQFLFDAIKEDTATFVKKTFVRINEIKIKGISTDKLMELELLSIPELDGLIKSRNNFDKALLQVKETGFFYPLRKLYVNDATGWNLTEEFSESLDNFVQTFTVTTEQNKVLETLEQMVNSFNELVKFKVLRPNHGPNELTRLFQMLSIDIANENPYSIANDVFKRTMFSDFKLLIQSNTKAFNFKDILQ